MDDHVIDVVHGVAVVLSKKELKEDEKGFKSVVKKYLHKKIIILQHFLVLGCLICVKSVKSCKKKC